MSRFHTERWKSTLRFLPEQAVHGPIGDRIGIVIPRCLPHTSSPVVVSSTLHDECRCEGRKRRTVDTDTRRAL